MTDTLKQQREAFAAQLADDPDARAWIEVKARELQRQAMEALTIEDQGHYGALDDVVIDRLLDAETEE